MTRYTTAVRYVGIKERIVARVKDEIWLGAEKQGDDDATEADGLRDSLWPCALAHRCLDRIAEQVGQTAGRIYDRGAGNVTCFEVIGLKPVRRLESSCSICNAHYKVIGRNQLPSSAVGL